MAGGLFETIGIFVAGTVLTAGAVAATLIKKRKDMEITAEEGVFRSKGKYYAYCPQCGKMCSKPQIIAGAGKNHLNLAKFRCFDCNLDFEKSYDYELLKG